MSSTVVVATFPGEPAALVARALLEAHDIPSIISGDGASSMEPQLQFIQGVRLIVREDDAEDARAILESEPTSDLESPEQ